MKTKINTRCFLLASLLFTRFGLAGAAMTEAPEIPNGFRSSRFGMTLEEAKQALVGSFLSRDLPGEVLNFKGEDGSFSLSATIPGKRIEVYTSLGPTIVRCELWFAVRDRLSKIICEPSSYMYQRGIIMSSEAIGNTLKAKYGEPSRANELKPGVIQSTWSSSKSRLEFARKQYVQNEWQLVFQSLEHLALEDSIKENTKRELERQRNTILAQAKELAQDL